MDRNIKSLNHIYIENICILTVKLLISHTSKEFIKCRILHFLIMECCRYLVFKLNDYMELFKTVPANSLLFIYFRELDLREIE